MSNSKRNKSEMAPNFQKNRKLQDNKNESLKPGDKAQPTAEQIRIAQITDTKPVDPELREKVKHVMDVTQKSEDEVLIALHDCDNDIEQAASNLLDGSCREWSTSTKKKKSKPPADKQRDIPAPNSGAKSTNAGTSADGGDDWNESDNADDNSAPNKTFNKGKGPVVRSNRPPSRSFVKRGGTTRSSNGKDFNRGSEANDWSKGGSKPLRGRTVYKNSRNSTQKDCENSDREISERLGQSDIPQDKHDSGSDWGSDNSDHQKPSGPEHFENAKPTESFSKQQMSDMKWQSDDQYWSKNTGRGGSRGGSRGRGGYSSYFGKQMNEENDSRGSYFNKSSNVSSNRGRGRYSRPNRGDGRMRPRDGRYDYSNENDTNDRGSYRGRMSNGPSNRGWKGSRVRSRGGARPMETWNPHTSQTKDNAAEDWDQEEEVYTGSLADTKVFTPSSAVEAIKIVQDAQKDSAENELSNQLINQTEVPGTLPPSSQFLSQLTTASAGNKPVNQSVFNDVHFSKSEISTGDFSGSFSMNTFSEPESPSNLPVDDISRVKTARPRLPPPSKIPLSAVEMPPDVGSGIALVDVQFGALELGDMMENVQQPAPHDTPPPSTENIPAQTSIISGSSEPPLLINESQTYTSVRSNVQSNPMSQLPELLSSKSEPPASSYYQDSVYQSNQFSKSSHQSFNSNYTTQVGSTYNTQSIYGSAGLGTTSLSNPYQTYSGNNIQRHSALTSTTNSKEFDVPTPSVNISPINPSSGTTVTPSSILSSAQGSITSKSTSSNMSKMMTVPPGVPPIVNAPYIMNQTGVSYYQPPMYSIEDYQLLQQQRITTGIPNYYEMAYPNATSREQYNMQDTRFAQGETNTSPVQATSLNAQTGSQNHQQPMMNPALQSYYYFSGSVIPGNYQYGTPTIYHTLPPSGTGSGHGNASTPYAKTPTNYTGSYTGTYEGSQAGPEYKSANNQVSKVQPYQVTNASTSTGLSNIYSKSYDKTHSFCQTPPPYTPLGSQTPSGLGPTFGAQPQQVFYSPVTPHHTMHQPLHQDSASAANSRAQLASQSSKVNSKPNKYSATGYWHQQN